MKVMVLSQLSNGINLILAELSKFTKVEFYETLEELLANANSDAPIIVLEYEQFQKETNNHIKKIRKVNSELPIVLVTNVLSKNELIEHQESDTGADLYVRAPATATLLEKMFNQFYDSEFTEKSQLLKEDLIEESGEIDFLTNDQLNLSEPNEVALTDSVKHDNTGLSLDLDSLGLESNTGHNEASGMLSLSDTGISKSLDLDELNVTDTPSLEVENNTNQLLETNTASVSNGELSLDLDASFNLPLELTNTNQKKDVSVPAFELPVESPGLVLDSFEENSSSIVETQAKIAENSMSDISMSSDALNKLREIEEMMKEDDTNSHSHSFTINADVGLQGAEPNEKTMVGKLNLFTAEDNSDFQITTETGLNGMPETIAKSVANDSAMSDELERLGETIKALREDRERLLEDVKKIEHKKSKEEGEIVSLKAMLDERTAELTITRKRFEMQLAEAKQKQLILNEKKDLLEQKILRLNEELLVQKKDLKFDSTKMRARESELESKLELLKADAQVQIRNRDHLILELKRRVDTLEFDIENMHIKEKQHQEGRKVLEEKLNKAVGTIKVVLDELDDEASVALAIEALKKNLDV